MALQRNAQGYILGLGRSTGAASATLTGTLQTNALLQDMRIQTDQGDAMVSAIRCAGQNVMVTDQAAPAAMFAPTAKIERAAGLGIPLESRQTVSIDIAAAGAQDVSAGVAIEPITETQVIPTSELGSALDYVGGLGAVSVVAGADGTLSGTIRRPVNIGRLIALAAAPNSITVRSITLNNVELLAGAEGAGGEFAVEMMSPDASDEDGLVLGVVAQTNDQLQIIFHNYNAGDVAVSAGFYVLPALS